MSLTGGFFFSLAVTAREPTIFIFYLFFLMGLFFCVAFYRDAVQLSIRAHSCFPESEMFTSLSTLTPENMMDTLALIFKGKSCTQCG